MTNKQKYEEFYDLQQKINKGQTNKVHQFFKQKLEEEDYPNLIVQINERNKNKFKDIEDNMYFQLMNNLLFNLNIDMDTKAIDQTQYPGQILKIINDDKTRYEVKEKTSKGKSSDQKIPDEYENAVYDFLEQFKDPINNISHSYKNVIFQDDKGQKHKRSLYIKGIRKPAKEISGTAPMDLFLDLIYKDNDNGKILKEISYPVNIKIVNSIPQLDKQGDKEKYTKGSFYSGNQKFGSIAIPYLAFYPDAKQDIKFGDRNGDKDQIVIPAMKELLNGTTQPDLSPYQDYIGLAYLPQERRFHFLKFKELSDYYILEDAKINTGSKGWDTKLDYNIQNSWQHFIESLSQYYSGKERKQNSSTNLRDELYQQYVSSHPQYQGNLANTKLAYLKKTQENIFDIIFKGIQNAEDFGEQQKQINQKSTDMILNYMKLAQDGKIEISKKNRDLMRQILDELSDEK